eukprot:scaffold75006_cov36-Tisochrysis_lutea.AAC.5
MVLSKHLAHDLRALAMLTFRRQVEFMHRIEDPAVDWLETVAQVGQRPRHDDRHGVRHVRVGHLLVEHGRNHVALVVLSECERGAWRWRHALGALGRAIGAERSSVFVLPWCERHVGYER